MKSAVRAKAEYCIGYGIAAGKTLKMWSIYKKLKVVIKGDTIERYNNSTRFIDLNFLLKPFSFDHR